MKRLKIACLCLVLITVPVIIESCCWNSCCGESFTQRYYDVDSFALTPTAYPAAPPFPAVSGPAVVLRNVALQVSIETTYISGLTGRPGYAAYACSPPPDISKQTITSLVITSNANFTTTTHTVTAGLSLNEFFGVYYYNNPSPIDDLTGSTDLRNFSLRSDDEMNKPQTHTFTVTITLDDGRVFELESAALDLAQG